MPYKRYIPGIKASPWNNLIFLLNKIPSHFRGGETNVYERLHIHLYNYTANTYLLSNTEQALDIKVMKERVSKLTYPTLQHRLRMLYTMTGNSGISDGQSKKTGDKLLLNSCKMHIYTLCRSLLQSFTQFCWAVSAELCWVVLLDKSLTGRSMLVLTIIVVTYFLLCQYTLIHTICL